MVLPFTVRLHSAPAVRAFSTPPALRRSFFSNPTQLSTVDFSTCVFVVLTLRNLRFLSSLAVLLSPCVCYKFLSIFFNTILYKCLAILVYIVDVLVYHISISGNLKTVLPYRLDFGLPVHKKYL